MSAFASMFAKLNAMSVEMQNLIVSSRIAFRWLPPRGLCCDRFDFEPWH